MVVHLIENLPNETKEDMINSVKYACSFKIAGIKIQMLNILKGTALDEIYSKNPFPLFTMEEYTDLVCELIEYIPPKVAIHRLTGDGPKDMLTEPKWVLNKRLVLNTIMKKMREK